MTLLIVIILTVGGMSEPQVFRLPNEAACVALLPKAEALAQQYGKLGYVVACVRPAGVPNA